LYNVTDISTQGTDSVFCGINFKYP
jgi:hypothetical protein